MPVHLEDAESINRTRPRSPHVRLQLELVIRWSFSDTVTKLYIHTYIVQCLEDAELRSVAAVADPASTAPALGSASEHDYLNIDAALSNARLQMHASLPSQPFNYGRRSGSLPFS